MSEATFRFRQFTIHQDKCAMKVGTDSVLLGSWINPAQSSDILDIGTGSGIIALMLAQKSFAQIDAIDVDENACKQAEENFKISPWQDRLHVIHQSFQDYAESTDKKYDLIVSNPPYFQDAFKPAEEAKLKAKHGDLLCFAELVDGVKKLLTEKGKFCLILPYREGNEFIGLALRKGLFCEEIVRVKTKADKVEKRLMMTFTFHFGMMTETELVIQEDENNFSKEYIELTKDYYLGLESRH